MNKIDLKCLIKNEKSEEINNISTHLPVNHKTFVELLKTFWLEEDAEYTFYSDNWHTYDRWETWEYQVFDFSFSENWFSFKENWYLCFESCPQEFDFEDTIISFIKTFEENDVDFNSKRIEFKDWEFFIYEVNKETLKEFQKISELAYWKDKSMTRIVFNPKTKVFEKYQSVFWTDLTEEFNSSLNQIISIIENSKLKDELVRRIKKCFPDILEYIDLKNGDITLEEKVHKYLEWDKIKWVRSFILEDFVYYEEKIKEDRRTFTVEEILEGWFDNSQYKIHLYDFCQKDIPNLLLAIDKWYFISDENALSFEATWIGWNWHWKDWKWVLWDKKFELLNDEYKIKNKLNKEKNTIELFNSFRKNKNEDFGNYVQIWLRHHIVNPIISEENFQKIVKTLNNYELSQVYLSIKDEERAKFVFNLIDDSYKKFKNLK